MAGGSSAERLNACMPFIFKEEGGLSLIRADRGNWTGGAVGKGQLKGTKYGIAAHSHPNLDIQNLSKDQATILYANEYWGPSGCPALPAGVDLQIFDHSVNAGVSRGKAHAAATGDMAPQPRIKAIAARRASWYRGIKDFSRFGKVWLGRVARAEALGLKLAMSAAGVGPVVISQTLQKEAEVAKGQVKKGQTGAAAAGGALTVPASGATVSHDVSWGLVIVGTLVCIGLMLLAVHFIRAKFERQKALSAEAGVL